MKKRSRYKDVYRERTRGARSLTECIEGSFGAYFVNVDVNFRDLPSR